MLYVCDKHPKYGLMVEEVLKASTLYHSSAVKRKRKTLDQTSAFTVIYILALKNQYFRLQS